MFELANELGSVAEAGTRSKMDRTSFSAYQRRFPHQGLEGRKELRPSPRRIHLIRCEEYMV